MVVVAVVVVVVVVAVVVVAVVVVVVVVAVVVVVVVVVVEEISTNIRHFNPWYPCSHLDSLPISGIAGGLPPVPRSLLPETVQT